MTQPTTADNIVATEDESELESPPICPGDSHFLELVLQESGENILACYQCHKCASGCPVADKTDYTNDKLIRLIQLGQEKKALTAKHLYTCVSCYQCSARCPNNINGARLVEALKQIAHRRGVRAAKPHVETFHDTFLMSVRHFGRVNEAELMGVYSLKAGIDWKMALMAPGMFLKGRLRPVMTRIKNIKELKKLLKK